MPRDEKYGSSVRQKVRETGKMIFLEWIPGDAPDERAGNSEAYLYMARDIGDGKTVSPKGFTGLYAAKFQRQLRLQNGVCEPIRKGYFVCASESEAERESQRLKEFGYTILVETWKVDRKLSKT